MSPPCRLYVTTGSCRYGDRCKFAHTGNRPSPANTSSSPARATADKGKNRATSASVSPRSTQQLPNRACRSFWTTGQCDREFRCNFRHERPAAGGSRINQSGGPAETSVIDAIAPFFTEAGLAKITGSGTDGFFSTNPTSNHSPSEVHNSLQRFLSDDFRFKTTFDVYAFLVLLSSANTTNTLWTSEDGQLLLSTRIATENGLLRITDIIQWPEVSVRAGMSKTTLSFQRGYFPLLRYLSSDFVVKSTMKLLVNDLYMRVLEEFDRFADILEGCVGELIAARSFKDPQNLGVKALSGSQVFPSIAGVLYEFLTRFKNVVARYPRLTQTVRRLREWVEVWVDGVTATPPTFGDPYESASLATREHITKHLKNKVDGLVTIIEREESKVERSLRKEQPVHKSRTSMDGVINALRSTYDPPGELREDGPRHDNDFLDIENIRIAPTHEELVSDIRPFLPTTWYEAPHPFPADSMQRLLDIQFRLLREELTAPLRASVRLVLDDLKVPPRKTTKLSTIIKKRGGKYRGQDVMFNVYTNVSFAPLVPDRRGISVGIEFDTPPGRARSKQAKDRVAFWEGKNLMSGGLVALVWKSGGDFSVNLGIFASSSRELSDAAKRERVTVRIVFFDPAVELRILQRLKRPELDRNDTKFLVEAPVMFEAIRPFLEALRVHPDTVPFARYLVLRPPRFFEAFSIQPPAYASIPGFHFQLASLFPPGSGIQDLKLSVTNPTSVDIARRQLRQRSMLDPSQADAVVDTLVREVSLIQGPPGTGKSYTGVQLLRVLLANKVGPVLLIALTNHALDHMLCSVLDAQITTNIVRLGSRSADERISPYSLETMEKVAGQSRLDRAFGRNYRALKEVEDEVKRLIHQFLKIPVDSDQIVQYLEVQYPEHYEHTVQPPPWIAAIKNISSLDGGWQKAGKKGKNDAPDDSTYAYWRDGRDLDFLEFTQDPGVSAQQPLLEHISNITDDNMFKLLESSQASPPGDDIDPTPNPEIEGNSQSIDMQPQPSPSQSLLQLSDLRNPEEFFMGYGYDGVPSTPSLDRDLDILLDCGELWSMSRPERTRLHAFWIEHVRSNLHQNQLHEFERLRERHAEVLQRYNEGKDEARRQLLQNVDIVGCTTTGAAKLTSLLTAIAPRIMLVEEAGQVLEGHIIGSLVQSVQHTILIGDPLQLRPTLNNYSLSVDNPREGQLYKFDVSLMERLATAGLPMSRIDVQRRMRPQISSLIRNTLYPDLEDHDLVKQYPSVRGIGSNVFFFSHSNRENGDLEDSASKFNMFEVGLIKDLVLYLLRQGCYSQDGDIVVLCAYLGQLARVRDALSHEVVVVIDDRDQEALADREDDQDGETSLTGVEHVKVGKRVRLRTVDNYQGEEAKIIILSLVRNSGASDEEGEMFESARSSIGFLKSENRTNVALSRAREGLFILGNALNLAARSPMWRKVIEELRGDNAVGDALPIKCHLHPDIVAHISQPGQLPRLAPDGGCLRPCEARLKCGHHCPYKCHSDDPNHIAVTCSRPCRKLCLRGHPCRKQCGEICGDCIFPVSNVELPCGHGASAVPCHLMDSLGDVFCNVVVSKLLPNCEHAVNLMCSEDPAQHLCKATCGGIMSSCCGRSCGSRCHECQLVNGSEGEGPVSRQMHRAHTCKKTLNCEHPCRNMCSQDHECTTTCQEPCRQICSHARCNQVCSVACAPCQEPCTWNCAHYACPLPCGSICARLPCDRRCNKLLQCGHRCSSVCGEDCSIQICPFCANEDAKTNVVDLVMYRKLEDIDINRDTLDEILITIPNCLHFFTAETLDGLCDMNEFYRRDGPDGQWIDFKDPPTGYLKPPTCPTCRCAITSPRYGRIFKRADLDILERNVASEMARGLEKAHTLMGSSSKPQMEATLKTEGTNLVIENLELPTTLPESRIKSRAGVLNQMRESPVVLEAINPGNTLYHGISPVTVAAWRKATSTVYSAYSQSLRVAKTRSAHVNAWEAAFSSLFDQEVDLIVGEPLHHTRNPNEHAMRMARIRVGQPPPRADKRFLVEAFWMTLHLRFIMASLAQTWLETMSGRPAYSDEERQIWATYIEFLFSTCTQDAQIALDIAKKSESHRQVAKTALLVMRAELEGFRAEIFLSRAQQKFEEDREKLIERATRGAKKAARDMATIIRNHRVLRRATSVTEEETWLKKNFSETAQTIVDEWSEIERTLKCDVFYQPVSLEDKMEIVRAFDFGHVGHFYNCPNGHTFVITECGGAMERASCPECGQSIGGTSHALDPTNTRAVEFEQLAQQRGAREHPWGWG